MALPPGPVLQNNCLLPSPLLPRGAEFYASPGRTQTLPPLRLLRGKPPHWRAPHQHRFSLVRLLLFLCFVCLFCCFFFLPAVHSDFSLRHVGALHLKRHRKDAVEPGGGAGGGARGAGGDLETHLGIFCTAIRFLTSNRIRADAERSHSNDPTCRLLTV